MSIDIAGGSQCGSEGNITKEIIDVNSSHLRPWQQQLRRCGFRPLVFAGPAVGPSSATRLSGRELVYPQAVPFPLTNVRLGVGAFSAAAEANRRYLKCLPTDRLLHPFLLTADLPPSAEPLGNHVILAQIVSSDYLLLLLQRSLKPLKSLQKP